MMSARGGDCTLFFLVRFFPIGFLLTKFLMSQSPSLKDIVLFFSSLRIFPTEFFFNKVLTRHNP
ncbi:uncharacterized protein DS421_3g74250 [Arachis hypogaea]|nr:uncharacterized protein DS421_3g74250 [Arachis hypogaea]